jgi:hypothetical protein
MTGSTDKPRVSVDFQNNDSEGRVRLNTVGTLQDLNRQGIILREGLKLLLYCLELETEGIVTYSAVEKLWVAKVDLDKIRDRK